MAAPLCECGGRKAHHTGDEGCWCPTCLQRPEAARCLKMVPTIESPRPPVDRNTAPVGHRHPQTAHDAAERALPRTGTHRREIYDLIRKSAGGLTDDEIENVSGKRHETVSATRNSLYVDGLIYDTGQRRLTRRDNDAIVWKVRTLPG